MLSSERKFVLIVVSILFIFSSFYGALCFYQVGAHVKAEWWLRNVYDYKDHIAHQKESPKIIIISGSNSLFGVDSSIIENHTGFPVVNLSGHANLDISFIYLKLKEHMKTGDIVVMPLEFVFFQRSKITDWFANNMLAWGEDDYLSKLDYLSLFIFMTSVPKSRIYKGVLKQNGAMPVLGADIAISNVEHLIRTKGTQWRGYDYTSLNLFGDVVPGEEVSKELLEKSRKGIHYYGGWDISDRFIDYYKEIEKLVTKNDGKLILTWSVMMKNSKFDISAPKYQNRVNRLRETLYKEGIYISCYPELFQYEVELFFDFEHHLNKSGATIRSKNLSLCINQTLQLSHN